MPASSAFDPQSGLAQPIYHLFVVTLVMMGAILLLVSGLIAYILIRYKAGNQTPVVNFGNRKLELFWTAGPILLLAFLFTSTVSTIRASDPVPAAKKPDLIITAYQWWWQVEYPEMGVLTANEIHFPAGKRLLVQLVGGDVIHDFWVAALGRKEDMIPGFQNRIWLEADRPGIYLGSCAEYCGAEHALMRIRVIAEPQEQFDHWIQEQELTPPAPDNADAIHGSKLFQQLTCANCHAVTGTGTSPNIGPNLTHVASRQTLGAGALNNTPDDLAKWLQNPEQFKPGSHMPNLQLKPDQIHFLTAYLETLQ
jgi:cytochrome c oxidase subunit 2